MRQKDQPGIHQIHTPIGLVLYNPRRDFTYMRNSYNWYDIMETNVVNEAKAARPERAAAPTNVERWEQRVGHDDDQSLPVNWSDTYKGWTVFTLSSMSFIV